VETWEKCGIVKSGISLVLLVKNVEHWLNACISYRPSIHRICRMNSEYRGMILIQHLTHWNDCKEFVEYYTASKQREMVHRPCAHLENIVDTERGVSENAGLRNTGLDWIAGLQHVTVLHLLFR
jgi:hypothetical protein